jgi:hypothetical protein
MIINDFIEKHGHRRCCNFRSGRAILRTGHPPPYYFPLMNDSEPSKNPSEPQLATDSTRSPNPKPATSSSTTRLSPSELESLRQETTAARTWAKAELAKSRAKTPDS